MRSKDTFEYRTGSVCRFRIADSLDCSNYSESLGVSEDPSFVEKVSRSFALYFINARCVASPLSRK